MPTTADIVSKMVAALRVSLPDLDTTIGTPTRKILDVVGEQISEAYSDGYLINYQYDVDSKSGGDLDDFCALFGITRIPAQRAQGVITFTRPNDATANATVTTISPGTQVIALTNPIVYVQTTVSAVLSPGQTSVDVPAQAVVAGTTGNVAATLANTIATSLSGITSCVNAAPFTGGLNQEADDALRLRFKQTVFRSLAGTQSMYDGICRAIPQDPSTPSTFAISATNPLGSSKRWVEQLQVAGGTATSTVTNAAYIFADNAFCAVDLSSGNYLNPGSDFIFTPTNPTDGVTNASAVLTSGNNAKMPDGLYDLSFEYVPQASRNDPANTRFAQGGINNRVDVWVNGSVPVSATQNVVFSNAMVFSSSPTSTLYNIKFTASNPTNLTPPVGGIFIPLSFGPILSLPASITIGGTTYNYQSDYWFVHRNDCFGNMVNSQFGILWTTTAGRIPTNGTVLTLTYTYDNIVRLTQSAMDQWRLLGTDAKAHAGKKVLLQFNFALIYDQRFDSTVVNTNINTALSTLLATKGFDAQLTVSESLTAVLGVPGVLNARFLTSTDNSVQYGICRMSNYAPASSPVVMTIYNRNGRATDVSFADDQYPVFFGTTIVAKAVNSFLVGS